MIAHACSLIIKIAKMTLLPSWWGYLDGKILRRQTGLTGSYFSCGDGVAVVVGLRTNLLPLARPHQICKADLFGHFKYFAKEKYLIN